MKKPIITLVTLFALLSTSLTYGATTEKKTTTSRSSSSNAYPPITPTPERTWETWAFAGGMVVTALIGVLVVNSNQGKEAYPH